MVSFRGRLSPRKLPSPNFYIYIYHSRRHYPRRRRDPTALLFEAGKPPTSGGGGRELHHLGCKPSQQSAEESGCPSFRAKADHPRVRQSADHSKRTSRHHVTRPARPKPAGIISSSERSAAVYSLSGAVLSVFTATKEGVPVPGCKGKPDRAEGHSPRNSRRSATSSTYTTERCPPNGKTLPLPQHDPICPRPALRRGRCCSDPTRRRQAAAQS